MLALALRLHTEEYIKTHKQRRKRTSTRGGVAPQSENERVQGKDGSDTGTLTLGKIGEFDFDSWEKQEHFCTLTGADARRLCGPLSKKKKKSDMLFLM